MTSRLDAIKARAEAATDGPWRVISDYIPGVIEVEGPTASNDYVAELSADKADLEFIAHARQDIPALAAAVEAVLELHQPCITRSAWQTCNECWNSGTAEGHNYEIDVRLSSASVDPVTGFVLDIVYPCPTVAAIQSALGEQT